jgi:MFS family permease
VTRTHAIYLAYGTAFSAMEFTLVFLAAERLGYGPAQNGWMFGFIGLLIALTQGGLVRRLAPRIGERRLARLGLLLLIPGFVAVGLAHTSPVLYLGLALLAVGSALEMPSLSGLVSLYAPPDRQGLAMGTFRSMGALSRAIGPLLGAGLYWALSPSAPYLIGAVALLWPLWLARGLPEPPTTARATPGAG